MTSPERGRLRDAVRDILCRMDGEDLQALVPAIADLLQRQGFEYWWTRREIYQAFEQRGIHVSRNHFYSPLPDTAEAARHLARDMPLTAARHVLSADAFAAAWRDISGFAHELADVPRDGTKGFFWNNIMFPNLDAITYYCMIRRHRPRRVLEIGSGFSTHIARRALQRNGTGRLQIVEPYPTPTLREVLGEADQVHELKIQDVPNALFEQLEDGDILFVDSSHVCKTGSDLNHILFEILPAIRASVFVHFHDIFLPYEYPTEWIVGRGWGWNEQYLLLAFLMGNPAARPLVGSALMRQEHQPMLQQDLAAIGHAHYDGGSLWLRMDPAAARGASSGVSVPMAAPPPPAMPEDPLRALRAEPWRDAATPPEVLSVVSMLTAEEKQFLHWLTAEYVSGEGAIVDAGCFAGGSTVALAAGLARGRARAPALAARRIDSYDMFLVDDFMRTVYFEPNAIRTEGARFRNVYDANTAPWRDMLTVHDGDITTFPWTGGPIELLFIDICKAWHVNDFVVRSFFPNLIPGRSIVVQQDFFHHMEFWVIVTHELLHEYFDYVGFVRWNSAVFRSRKPVPPDAIPADLRALGLTELDRLLRRHIERYGQSYQVGMLTCALACLHIDFGSLDEARRLHAAVVGRYAGQQWVVEAAKDVERLLGAAEAARRTGNRA